MEIIGPILHWESSFCSCRASLIMGNEVVIDFLCSDEHLPWTEKIAHQVLREKEISVQKAFRSGIPKSFNRLFERYTNGDCSFHRPPEVALNTEAVNAEFGLYILESLGVEIDSCSDPVKYADYLAGKAGQGLSEKTWIEDYRKREDDALLFLPEEFVASGDIDLKSAEGLFGREMNQELLYYLQCWNFLWQLGYSD